MPRGIYTVSFDQQTIAAASGDYDLFEIAPAANKPVELVAIDISNKTEVGDTQEEMAAVSIVRGNTTSGNGTATTPRPTDPSDAAASFAAETVGSTPASAGTAVTLLATTFNVRAGMQYIFPEQMRPKVANAELLCVRLTTALADDATFSGTVWVREL